MYGWRRFQIPALTCIESMRRKTATTIAFWQDANERMLIRNLEDDVSD